MAIVLTAPTATTARTRVATVTQITHCVTKRPARVRVVVSLDGLALSVMKPVNGEGTVIDVRVTVVTAPTTKPVIYTTATVPIASVTRDGRKDYVRMRVLLVSMESDVRNAVRA